MAHKVAAFFHVHLEQVAHVVKRRRGQAEEALLFDRAWLRVALDHDETTQKCTVFTWHFLPGRLTRHLATRDAAIFDLWGKQDAPAVFRHFDVVELGPTFWVN